MDKPITFITIIWHGVLYIWEIFGRSKYMMVVSRRPPRETLKQNIQERKRRK